MEFRLTVTCETTLTFAGVQAYFRLLWKIFVIRFYFHLVLSGAFYRGSAVKFWTDFLVGLKFLLAASSVIEDESRRFASNRTIKVMNQIGRIE